MEIDLKSLVNFLQGQIKIFEMLPASDYSNGIIEGMTLVLKHINIVTRGG